MKLIMCFLESKNLEKNEIKIFYYLKIRKKYNENIWKYIIGEKDNFKKKNTFWYFSDLILIGQL